MNNFFRNLIVGSALCGALWLGGAEAARADLLQNISGMAGFGDNGLVLVSDCKAHSSDYRMALYFPYERGHLIVPVWIDNWGDEQQARSTDWESICLVPNSNNEYFCAESGFWKGSGGRVFRVAISHSDDFGWRGHVVDVFEPFPVPEDGTTADELQIEGMQAMADGAGGYNIIFGLRGSETKDATIVIGNYRSGKFKETSRTSLNLQQFIPGGRSCSDLLIYTENGQKRLMSLAATDWGDMGPFMSCVCDVGYLESNGDLLKFVPQKPVEMFHFDGFKMEAVDFTPKQIGKSRFCVATDDELYSPVVRPLPIKDEVAK